MLSLANHSDRDLHRELDKLPGEDEPAEPTEQEPQPKPKAKTTKSKPPRAPPLPATVQILGHEVTIPNTKICWRVNFVHTCGHPVMKISQERYPGCDKPLVAEVNRHMRPCTARCKIEGLNHAVEGLCDICRQSEENERAETFSFWVEDVDESGVAWGGMPGI